MPTFDKEFLSGSTNGRGIKITTTATAGDTIHTATSSTTHMDEVYLYAMNSDTTDRLVTVEFGGATDPDDLVEYTVPAQDGAHLIIPGWPLNNTLAVKVFAETANVITVNGYVNRVIKTDGL